MVQRNRFKFVQPWFKLHPRTLLSCKFSGFSARSIVLRFDLAPKNRGLAPGENLEYERHDLDTM